MDPHKHSERITEFFKFVDDELFRRVVYHAFLQSVGQYLNSKYKTVCRFKILGFGRRADLKPCVELEIYDPTLGNTSIRLDLLMGGRDILFQSETETVIQRIAKKKWTCEKCGDPIEIKEFYVDRIIISNQHGIEKYEEHHRFCLNCGCEKHENI